MRRPRVHRAAVAVGVLCGVAYAGLVQAPLGAVVEDPGPRGVVPKTGRWTGVARDADGRTFPLAFRVVRSAGRLEVRDLTTRGTSTCAQDDGSLTRETVPLKLGRAPIVTKGELRGVWTYVRGGLDVGGTFRPSVRMTGTFRAPPPDVSCNGTTVFLRGRLAVPAGR